MRLHAAAECYDYAKEHDILRHPGFKSLLNVEKKIESDTFDQQGKRKLKRREPSIENLSPSKDSDLFGAKGTFPTTICAEIKDMGLALKGKNSTWADLGAPGCEKCRKAGCASCYQRLIGADIF